MHRFAPSLAAVVLSTFGGPSPLCALADCPPVDVSESPPAFSGMWGSAGTGPGELNYPYGLALEKSGSLLIADRGNNRLVRWARDGVFLGAWGTHGRGRGQVAQPWDVALAVDGRVYCLDSWNNRVQLIDW